MKLSRSDIKTHEEELAEHFKMLSRNYMELSASFEELKIQNLNSECMACSLIVFLSSKNSFCTESRDLFF